MKLEVGQKMPDFTYDTAYKTGLSYLEETKGKKSVLLFLRYYGCPICQLDMYEMEDLIEKFNQLNVDVKIVLQSSKEILTKELGAKPVSYDIISDPDQTLYKEFELGEAADMEELGASPKLVEKVRKTRKAGYEHGEYEGNEMQYPALFIKDENDVIEYAHYAKDIADIPSSEEILGLVQ